MTRVLISVYLGGFERPTFLHQSLFVAVSRNTTVTTGRTRLTRNQVTAKYFLGSFFFLPALILAMAYTATQDARGQRAGFFFFTVPAQLIPICMLGATLLMAGPQAMLLQVTGLFAAHLHDFLTRLYPEFGGGSNWIPTPGFFAHLVTTPRVLQRDYGTAIRSSQTPGSSTGAQQGSGPLPDSWRTRGTGHRLG